MNGNKRLTLLTLAALLLAPCRGGAPRSPPRRANRTFPSSLPTISISNPGEEHANPVESAVNVGFPAVTRSLRIGEN